MKVIGQLIKAALEVLSSDPATVLAKARIWFNSTDNRIKYYDGSNVVGLAKEGEGGTSISSALFAETIDITNSPKTVCLAAKNCLTILHADSYIDIDEGGGEEATKILSADKVFLIYDLSITEDAYDLSKIIEDALNVNANLAFTYTVSYSKSTRKFTIAAGSVFSILHSSGTHAANNLCIALSYNVGSDDTANSSYEADNEISDSSSYGIKSFFMKTDAAYLIKSRNYFGVIDSDVTKGESAAVKTLQEFTVSGLAAGNRYYTKASTITIETGVNDALDFEEGGIGTGELNATLAAGSYNRGFDGEPGYEELCSAVKTALEAAGALTYTVTYNKNTELFTISASGDFNLLNSTGTNVATSCYADLGYDNTDTSSASSHASDNAVEHAGEIVLAEDGASNSVFTGIAITDTKFFATPYNDSQSIYNPIYQAPGDFLAAPETIRDDSQEMQLNHCEMNGNGYGVAVYSAPSTASSTLKLMYKKPGASWTLASTTIAQGTTLGEDFGGNFQLTSKVYIDENNVAVLAAAIVGWDVFVYTSTDLDTWTIQNSGSALATGGGSHYIGGVHIREGVAAIITNRSDNNQSQMHTSIKSGGNYASWTTSSLVYDMIAGEASGVFVRFDDSQVGAAKHQVTAIGKRTATTIGYTTFDGAGANEASGYVYNSTGKEIIGYGIDKIGTKNKICVFMADTGAAAVVQADSNDYTGGGAISFNNHAAQDINSGGGVFSSYIGYSAAGASNPIKVADKNIVVVDNYYYGVLEIGDNPSSKEACILFSSTNMSGGVTAKVNIGQASDNNQEPSIHYIESIHALLVIYKHNTNTLANNLTNGKMYAKLFEINTDGSLNAHDTEEIDGGKAMAGFAGYLQGCASSDSVDILFEEYNGSYDILKRQLFK